MGGNQNFEQYNPGVANIANSNSILNRRKQYRNVPPGNKLEQLSHPGHPSYPLYMQNLKQMGGNAAQVNATRASFILNQQQKMHDI
jgi:hypothetical protein